MPKRQNLHSVGSFKDAIVKIVPNAREMKATDAGKGDVPSRSADPRLQGDRRGSTFKV
jgi:hypothetical protein